METLVLLYKNMHQSNPSPSLKTTLKLDASFGDKWSRINGTLVYTNKQTSSRSKRIYKLRSAVGKQGRLRGK